MPGEIKIDDGSGNYTILTNAGSLGSDKTITIPNETATLATTTATNLGGLVLLQTATASNDASLILDDFVDLNTYESYYIQMTRLKPATDNVALRVTFRQGGSSGSDLTGTDYYMAGVYAHADQATGAISSNNNYTDFSLIDSGIGNSTGEPLMGDGHLFPATGNANQNVNIFMTRIGVQLSSDYLRTSYRTLFKEDVTAVTGLKFYFSSGNITSGTIRIYGYKS